MKKIIIFTALILALCLTLSACGGKKQPIDDKSNNNNQAVNYQAADLQNDEIEDEIKAPVIDWWKVYTDTTKKNCVTIQVSNPNSFPIGFNFNLVFYKNNEVVKTEDMWAVTCVEPGKPGIIYGDIDIPSPTDVDKVEITNIEATKFQWKVLDSTFTKSLVDNGKQYFDVSFSGKPRNTEIWVALYNDSNGDKKVQAEEFVQMGLLAPFVGIYEEKGEIGVPVPDETFNDYQIYCVAFSMENAEY